MTYRETTYHGTLLRFTPKPKDPTKHTHTTLATIAYTLEGTLHPAPYTPNT